MLLDWLKERASGLPTTVPPQGSAKQGILWTSAAYQDEAPAIRSVGEFAGALEHLHYAVFRRYQNQLTRAERARLDNTIRNVLYKIERYVERLEGVEQAEAERELHAV
ncbi:restriction endonuclease, partial [Singulisphaera rosea]